MLQQRKRVADDRQGFRVVSQEVTWEPEQTAIIVVDMWNDHHCKSAAERVVEMAPSMNEVLEAARRKGVLIVHAPSGCMETYQGTAARTRAQSAPEVKTDVKFQWNYFNPEREGQLAEKFERAGCSCDLAEPCGPDKRVWTSQIVALKIHDEDAVSDDGQEIYNLVEQRSIDNVIVMGVHTNRCVLGRPFGIRQMAYLGKNVVLCRDLTDSYHRDPGKHFAGLDAIITHVEKYWCPTITTASITGQQPFIFAGNQRKE
ncbi:MAG: cysteine hydrolase family protein [Planctomycetes bacterium]|nr:cysteine hydrolase family protein [Planctomycetota bacterium]